MQSFLDFLNEQNIRATGWTKKDFTAFRNGKLMIMKKVVKYLDKNNVKWYADCGTLLGIYRDGKLLDTDNDVDISIKADDINENFFKAIDEMSDDEDLSVKKPCHEEWREQYKKGYLIPDERYYRITHKDRVNDKALFVDLMIWFPYKDCYFCYDGWLYRHKADLLKNFTTIVFRGMNVRIPKKTEDYLEEMYTENWNIPDSSWREGNQENYWFRWDDGKKEIKNYKFKI